MIPRQLKMSVDLATDISLTMSLDRRTIIGDLRETDDVSRFGTDSILQIIILTLFN